MNDPNFATIVLVDDDEAKRYSVAKILKKAKFHVVEAATGAEALRLAAKNPDLVILDVKLPDITGFEVCRRLKSDPATARIPVLHLSTTFVDIEDKVQGLEGGADAYLTDVLEPLELIATVRALLRARHAEEAAHLTVRQWQATFDAISDGVVLLDGDGKVVRINQAMERMLEIFPSEPIGKSFHELLNIAPSRAGSPFVRMLESGVRENVELKREERWFRVAVDPVSNQDGKRQGAVCIISDITDRRRMEEELRRRADELMAADLRKDEFLAMLAHELRNPLAPILNSLEEIRLSGPAELDTGRALDIAGRQVRHMARLLDDLLDVARFTRGKIQLRKGAVELTLVASLAAEAVRPRIEGKGQEFSLSLPSEPVWVEGDPTRLEQVLGNLLNNASKYTDAGGRIALTLERDGDEAVLRVADNGIGLSPDMLPRVFDLFSQADLSLDRAEGGLGIGLTLVRSLVEMHDGQVSAQSGGPGRGSEFVVRLPIARQPPPDASELAPSTSTTSQRRRRLLVVDDHRDSAQSLARVLRLWGHDVTVAHDGPSAIERFRQSPFDLILLDIGLPGMDGYQVAEILKETKGNAGPLLIALTGYGQDEDQRRAHRVGFDLHFVKPVDLETLHDLLVNLETHRSSCGLDMGQSTERDSSRTPRDV
ncbi:MAG: response regulator [Isosphaeraceae bacterium]|nr:response regulator [Isosphaeraceae bacterium]